MAGALTPETVEPLLSGRFGRPYLYEDTCESTQRLLDSQPEGAAAACDVQTGGRGRLGRTWSAPPGTAVLCSVVLEPPAERNIAELSLVGGLAVAETVEAATDLAAQIKWPNDVLVNRRKVAGVLAEAAEGRVVLGMGLNVNQTRSELPEDTSIAAGSLLTTDGVRRERAPILADLLLRLERAYDRWCEGGLDAIYDGLGARDFLRGRRLLVDGESAVGVAIDRSGRLEVEVDHERRVVESGEVLFER
jgi:BirA family transcriptional regulator, biotin operon repressor / biotin---[acetyl-CoA-carboxylase] ligase